MKILSKTLSERTAEIITTIERNVHLHVSYLPIAKRPNQSYGVAGTVNPYGENGIYPVWLDTRLPDQVFEADVLHELRHIVQAENGFSSVCNKETDAFHSKDRPFIQEVGSHIASTVLDIDVIRWLDQLGYSSEYFINGNFRFLMDNAGFNYTGLADPLNFANLTLHLLSVVCHLNEEDATKLYKAYSAYPEVIAVTQKLRESLLAMPLDTPQSTALAHGRLISELHLWGYYFVNVMGRKIRTDKEYQAFCTEVGFSPDK